MAINSIIKAWHCGSKSESTPFSLNHIRSGEGNIALGPGVYFITNKRNAIGYQKYSEYPVLYEVTIDASKLYNPFRGEPEAQNNKIKQIISKLCEKLNKSNYQELESHVRPGLFANGPDMIGVLDKLYGHKQAVSILINNDISGVYQEIQPSIYEIAVFDLSIITIDKVDTLKERPKHDLDFIRYSILNNIKSGVIQKIILNENSSYFSIDEIRSVLGLDKDAFNHIKNIIDELFPIILLTIYKKIDERISSFLKKSTIKSIDDYYDVMNAYYDSIEKNK